MPYRRFFLLLLPWYSCTSGAADLFHWPATYPSSLRFSSAAAVCCALQKKNSLHPLGLAKATDIHAKPAMFTAVTETEQIGFYEPTIMSALTNEKCTACRRDAPRVTEAEIGELRPQIPDWALVEREGIQRLERIFRFTNFAEALNFTNRVGAIAEEEGHHPAILTEWGPRYGYALDAQDSRSPSK